MKNNHEYRSRFRILKGGKIALVITALLGSVTMVSAAPSSGVVTTGTATISQTSNTTTITQTTNKASINWQSFNVAPNETVNFVQPSSSSITLNRVVGVTSSLIEGTINAKGQVFLLNPNGIIFSKDSQVNVGGLVASTLNMSDADFQAGNYTFTDSGSTQSVINQGTIDISNSGYAALFAKEVVNEGVIRAVQGNVSLVAAGEVSLNLNGNSLVSITVSKGVLGALVDNKQAIYTEGGDILLSATAVDSLMSSVVNNEGIVEASSLTDISGKISLSADIVVNNGSLKADGVSGGSVITNASLLIDSGTTTANATTGNAGIITQNANEIFQSDTARLSVSSLQGKGGKIALLGDTTNSNSKLYLSGKMEAKGVDGGEIDLSAYRVTLASASLDTSGTNNAGSIKIGGGFHGTDTTIENASYTSLDAQTNITNNGTGGDIVVWSDIDTLYAAYILAKGSDVEVSSKDILQFNGMVESKTLLLDPKNLEVKTGFSITNPNLTIGDLFGDNVVELSNGNFVITASLSDIVGGAADVGRVYLFSSTGTLISTLSGSTAGDQVGYNGVTALSNGNYVVNSDLWNNGGVADVGAVTWGDTTTGISGVVSSVNSLVGSTANDHVGSSGVTALSNGNYVVSSSYWNNGGIVKVGAVTWGDGTTGTTGVVNSANSLIGSTASDQVGVGGVTALSNGNYVLSSPGWNNGTTIDAGAVTWGDGTAGTSGVVSSSNSLVGSTFSDKVGLGGITALINGNYVVSSSYWNNGGIVRVGAVTWGDGTTGRTGVVSSANSLVGSTASDRVGRVTALTNGNYVVSSGSWDNGTTADVGAVTWGDGVTGTSGAVSSANSWIGSNTGDYVGSFGITALTNGNYVVSSPYLDNGGVADVGAVTWISAAMGTSGVVSALNSLIGSTASDWVGYNGVTALTNGNYVVSSAFWSNGGITRVGAVTWGDGTTGRTGVVSSANSLVGSTASDEVGAGGVTALTNGNYVVSSKYWNNGASIASAGAVTLGSGTTGTTGVVSSANSLIGSTASDQIGSSGITALTNGNYVVSSEYWNNGGIADIGAVTWGDGTTGIIGAVSSANSLVGSRINDRVGSNGVTAVTNGNYFVRSPGWDNGGTINAGAVTWGSGTSGIIGAVTGLNSLVGTRISAMYGFNISALSNKVAVMDTTDSSGGTVYFLDGLSTTTFSANPSENSFISPERITALLNAGTAVTLQANNDITVTNVITANNTGGNGGNLLLEAGRNINLNANITTDNGDFTAIAGSSSALAAYTDAGIPTITLGNGVSIDAGTGSIVLYANGGNFLNNSASVTPFTAASISIYLPSYTNATLNGLTIDNKRYNTTYANGLMTSGVNLYYELAPVLSVSPTTGQSVVYGSLASGYTLSGFVDGDTAADVSGTALYTQGGATSGSGNAVVGMHDLLYVSGLLSTNGYSFIDNAAQTNELTITPKAIIVSASSKVYDATTNATFSTIGIISGDAVTLSSATAKFDNANVGTAKTVTVTGLSKSGSDALNYSLATPLTTTADITPDINDQVLKQIKTPVQNGTAFRVDNIVEESHIVSAGSPQIVNRGMKLPFGLSNNDEL